MGDLQVSGNAMIRANPETENGIKKAGQAAGKFLGNLKDTLFGKTGKSILAGAAAGALVGAVVPGGVIPGAIVGGAVGLGTAAYAKASSEGKKGMAALAAASTGALAGLAFGLPGLLVGGVAYAFASGAAQNAAKKVGEFMSKNADKMAATAAPQQ